MGVFKWLRRERVTVTTHHNDSPDAATPEVHQSQSTTQGTIRTEEYKRDLAEFQARRSAGAKELDITPVKKKCGRHSIPVSCACTDYANDHDTTFNYEKKSAIKYKKNKHARSVTPEEHEAVPNIQFLFQNQVFMPGGNMFTTSSFSEPQKLKRHSRRSVSRSPEFTAHTNIDFKENERESPPEFFKVNERESPPEFFKENERESPPEFFKENERESPPEFFKENERESPPEFSKDNSLSFKTSFARDSKKIDDSYHLKPPVKFKNDSPPFEARKFDARHFSRGSRSSEEEIDGLKAAGDVKASSHRDNSGDDNLSEVMTELKYLDQWADEQLLTKSPNASRSDDSKSDTSAYGLPVASARNLDINVDKRRAWSRGRWGVVPVQTKRLGGVTFDHVRSKRNTEINILRKCRHPNIILLMGIYPDINNNVHIICERCVDSLFGILHVQGRILSAQTSVQYALDVANALVFLRMQGYLHTELSSMAVMITGHDTAKLADLGPCVKVRKEANRSKGLNKDYELYSPEPQYVNIEDTCETKSSDTEPLLSANSSETYLKSNAVRKPYEIYQSSELYRWQAPELFTPGEGGMVLPCSKSDVYSLCMILWESCNASIPWKLLSYEELKEQYTVRGAGAALAQHGGYPGCLLALLRAGLALRRTTRIDLETLQQTLQTVKNNLDKLGYIIIPVRLPAKKSNFSSVAWDTTSPTDSDCRSPQNIELEAVVHNAKEPTDSATENSEKDCSKSDPLYETIQTTISNTSYSIAQKCFIQDDDNTDDVSLSKYELMPEKEYSSACSTPIAKLRSRIKDIETPGALHRSDSTEYCSILSPNRTTNFGLNDYSNKDQSSVERSTAKLNRSLTPKSYKPLHIKVPEFNLDSIKPLLKEQNGAERSSYNFDIKNYSLPNTPIARSNKLRKNAWLSGDLAANYTSIGAGKQMETRKSFFKTPSEEECIKVQPEARLPESPETIPKSTSCSPEAPNNSSENNLTSQEPSPASIDTVRDTVTGLKRSAPRQDLAPEAGGTRAEPRAPRGVRVQPLVAVHERWICEANRKAGRSMSLPEENSFRSQVSAVKPASHCVDTLQMSLPQLNPKKSPKTFRMPPSNTGGRWEQFCQARDAIAKGVNFTERSPDRYHSRKKDSDKGIATEDRIEPKIDQCTDTKGMEDFIRDLIRNEFQHLLHEISDDNSTTTSQDVINKGVSNIMESLNNDDAEKTSKKDPVKSFSRVKINGNNKPLLHITFSRSGENSLQVLDSCVNVTICDNPGREKLNASLEETLAEDMQQAGGLKRCQAFNAIQEARSTEDLYIDDDLSTHMQENFGGKVKLIPLHGSLHEILCEKEDDCCLIKVKQENGCDAIYFRCDNSDTESRDAIDGCEHPQDTVVFKRSISLIEERIQRIIPKDKRAQTPVLQRKRDVKIRPKSEVFTPISRETRVLSNSSPSLATNDAVEVNIENVMCYQDSSSDECLKCQTDNDDFELLERKIEQDIANKMTLGCGCLGKISEENLAALNEDPTE